MHLFSKHSTVWKCHSTGAESKTLQMKSKFHIISKHIQVSRSIQIILPAQLRHPKEANRPNENFQQIYLGLRKEKCSLVHR